MLIQVIIEDFGLSGLRLQPRPNPPHGMDVAYVFQHLDSKNPQTTKTDLEISKAMSCRWQKIHPV